MPVLLRGGKETNDRRLDWVYPGVEAHMPSLRFLARDVVDTSKIARSLTHRLSLFLDQGQEGACVGFGVTHDLAASPGVVSGLTAKFARERIYWEAQKRDPWPGGAYPGASPFMEGTAVLTGIQVAQELGYYSEYRWSLDLRDVVFSVGYKAPVIIGVDVYDGMYRTDAKGFIHTTGSVQGGHCMVIIGVRTVKINKALPKTWDNVDWDKSYFVLHNSWGPRWGVNGRAAITLREFNNLIPGSELAVCIRTRKKVAA